MDYYDYNVVNAGAAPGSYLGMDPAFLVWIPPLDDSGEIITEIELQPQNYVDLRPHEYINPGSNTESPEEELILPPKFQIRGNTNVEIKRKFNSKNKEKHKDNISSSSKESLSLPATELKKSDFKKSYKEAREKETLVEKLSEDNKQKVNIDDEIRFADDDEDECIEMENATKDKLFSTAYQDTNILTN